MIHHDPRRLVWHLGNPVIESDHPLDGMKPSNPGSLLLAIAPGSYFHGLKRFSLGKSSQKDLLKLPIAHCFAGLPPKRVSFKQALHLVLQSEFSHQLDAGIDSSIQRFGRPIKADQTGRSARCDDGVGPLGLVF